MKNPLLIVFLLTGLLSQSAFSSILIYDGSNHNVYPTTGLVQFKAEAAVYQSFSTDSQNWSLDSVSVDLELRDIVGVPVSGTETANVYLDTGTSPLTAPLTPTYGAAYTNRRILTLGTVSMSEANTLQTFSFSNLNTLLNPNSTYFIEVRATSGMNFYAIQYPWSGNSHSVISPTPTFTAWQDLGSGYGINNVTSLPNEGLSMQISATAVPEPSTCALFGLGALALIMVYRRKVAEAPTAFQ